MRFGEGGGGRFSREGQAFFNFERTLSQFERQADEPERIDPHDFVDLYGQANIEADLAYVREMESVFAREDNEQERNLKRISNAFETILLDRIELDNWFGENTMTIASSKYDDIKNGIDVIAEIGEEGSLATSHLGLAIDITYSSNLEKKFTRIRDEIASGRLTEVKYFQSPNGSFTGRLNKVPRVVIGLQQQGIGELMDLVVNKKTRELSTHPVQHQILAEIQAQLNTFTEFAHKRKAGKAVVQRLDHARGLIDGVVKEKKQEFGDAARYFNKDRVYQGIMDQLESKFK